MKGEEVMFNQNFNGNCNSDNGGLKQAVYHIPTSEELAQHANEMEKTQNAIATVGSDMMLVGSSILDANKTITVATDTLMSFVTKARKKKGGSELVQMSGKCVLVQKYSDGTADCKDFFMNIDGVFHGIIYQFPAEISSDEIVEMVMTEKIAVFFPLKRVNGEKLYQAFLAAGVYINPDIPVGVVKRELEKYIVSRINTFKVELIIPITGWNAGNWYRTGKDYMRFSKYIDFPTVPVAKKVFPVIAPGKWHVEDYFKILDHIQDRMLKMWIFIYPFLGMIASLMAKFGCRLNFCLNIVTDDEEVRREITRITAIFNRENVPIISLAENRSALNKEFSKYGDEVVFVSADKTVNQDYNNEKKIFGNAEYAVNILARNRNLPSPYNRPVYAGGVVLSNFPLALSGVITLYAEREDFTTYDEDYAVFDWVYVEFVKFVGKNFTSVTTMLNKAHASALDAAGMKVILQILDDFWKSHKINMIERFHAKDIDSLVEDMFSGDEFEDETELLRILIRKAVRGVPVYGTKDCVTEINDFCVATGDYLIIPVKLFDKWLEDANVKHIKKKVLVWLSNNGCLKTNNRYIYKFQSTGKRFDTYCIALKYLNKPGDIPVEKLGGRKNV